MSSSNKYDIRRSNRITSRNIMSTNRERSRSRSRSRERNITTESKISSPHSSNVKKSRVKSSSNHTNYSNSPHSSNIKKTTTKSSSSSIHNTEVKKTTASYDFVFTIGRMNPPTSGHALLLNELITNARFNNLNNVGIVLSHTEDNKNPISCEKKREYILQMISNMDSNIHVDILVDIICKNDIENYSRFPTTSINHLLQNNNLENTCNMLLIIGEDRADSYEWLKTIYPNLQIVALPRPPNAMSATIIRGYVSDKQKDAFDEAYENIYDKDTIDNLYHDISVGLSKYNKNQKSARKRGGKINRRTKKTRKSKRKH